MTVIRRKSIIVRNLNSFIIHVMEIASPKIKAGLNLYHLFVVLRIIPHLGILI